MSILFVSVTRRYNIGKLNKLFCFTDCCFPFVLFYFWHGIGSFECPFSIFSLTFVTVTIWWTHCDCFYDDFFALFWCLERQLSLYWCIWSQLCTVLVPLMTNLPCIYIYDNQLRTVLVPLMTNLHCTGAFDDNFALYWCLWWKLFTVLVPLMTTFHCIGSLQENFALYLCLWWQLYTVLMPLMTTVHCIGAVWLLNSGILLLPFLLLLDLQFSMSIHTSS